jgi:hypothetical protein
LRDLYLGEAWRCSLDLEARAEAAGFRPTLYVASAGLGLRDANDEAPAYAATFTAGQDDSVAESDAEARDWWAAMCAGGDYPGLAGLPKRPTLVVLSAAYGKPLSADLAALAATNPDVLVVGGTGPVPGATRIAADRSLRAELGGSVMSLNQRMAGAWLDRLAGRALNSADAIADWSSWSAKVQQVETWDRRTMTDEMVVRAVTTMLQDNARLSWSPALRILRESGYACEQKRFKHLFSIAVRAN